MSVLAAIVGLLLLAGLWLRDKAAEARWKADDARFAELEGKLRAEEAQRKALEFRLDNALNKAERDAQWAKVEKAFFLRAEDVLERGEA